MEQDLLITPYLISGKFKYFTVYEYMHFITSGSRFPQSSHFRVTFLDRMSCVSATSLIFSVPTN